MVGYNIQTESILSITFPNMLENYIGGVKKDLGYQSETSLVLGIDYYHYDENQWIHNLG